MPSKVKNRHSLKRKEIRNLQNEIKQKFSSIEFNEKSTVESGDVDGLKLIFIEGVPCFMADQNKIIFTLHGINRYKPKENFVTVDMGAVKFVTNGADVMAPGIVDADKNISEKDQVWICDEQHHKPLAIGIALITGEEMIGNSNGKAIKIIHYVGDTIWNFVAKSL